MRASILVVDDDEAIREGLETLLVDEGYEVHSAENGQVALELLRSGKRPSLVLLDLMMPVMDGREFCAMCALDAELAAIPIILFTAGSITPEIAALPVNEKLRKPADIDVLLETVRRNAIGKLA
ncbi:MAG TPA: response regulator [Bdellovibrionota bacterium]|nr:response regulator [Bdellovibrionota bacterium]